MIPLEDSVLRLTRGEIATADVPSIIKRVCELLSENRTTSIVSPHVQRDSRIRRLLWLLGQIVYRQKGAVALQKKAEDLHARVSSQLPSVDLENTVRISELFQAGGLYDHSTDEKFKFGVPRVKTFAELLVHQFYGDTLVNFLVERKKLYQDFTKPTVGVIRMSAGLCKRRGHTGNTLSCEFPDGNFGALRVLGSMNGLLLIEFSVHSRKKGLLSSRTIADRRHLEGNYLCPVGAANYHVTVTNKDYEAKIIAALALAGTNPFTSKRALKRVLRNGHFRAGQPAVSHSENDIDEVSER